MTNPTPTEQLQRMMSPEEAARIGVSSMTEMQRRALVEWGMRMFGFGRYTIAVIENIKYEGRLIVLDDGSKWEVDSGDASVAEMWSPFDKVLIADGEMFRLDETEMVHVAEDLD